MKEAAIWHWQVAQNLAVELRDQPLSAYGPAGEILAHYRLKPSPAGLVPTASDEDDAVAGDLAAPATIEAPSPWFPEGNLLVLAVVEVVVDEEGRAVEGSPRAAEALAALPAGHP